jgi:hypothetical protein
MFSDEIIGVMASAIQAEVTHPPGSMRLLPETEQELALAILNALDDAGFEVLRRDERPSV